MPTITIEDSCVSTIDEIRAFLKLDQRFEFEIKTKRERHAWIEEVLRKFSYHRLKKKKERTYDRYIQKVARISKAQLNRLMQRQKQCGKRDHNHSKH